MNAEQQRNLTAPNFAIVLVVTLPIALPIGKFGEKFGGDASGTIGGWIGWALANTVVVSVSALLTQVLWHRHRNL